MRTRARRSDAACHDDDVENSGWVAVRCVFREQRDGAQYYEERVTLWQSASVDEGIERAEAEAREYAEVLAVEYLGFAQGYLLSDDVGDGAEVFSLIRGSELDPEGYLDAFFDTGTERQATS